VNNDRKRQPLSYGERQPLKPFAEISPLFSASAADLTLRMPPSSLAAPVSASYRLSPKPSEMPYLVHWLQSGGNLDFMVLALCSCVLTVLCHQPTILPSETVSAPATTQSTEIDFAIRAALLTKFPKPIAPKLKSDDPDGFH
jgi:hypothetical protein